MNESDLVEYILTQQLFLASSMSFTQGISLLAIIYMLQMVICFTHNGFLSEFMQSLVRYIPLIFHSLWHFIVNFKIVLMEYHAINKKNKCFLAHLICAYSDLGNV